MLYMDLSNEASHSDIHSARLIWATRGADKIRALMTLDKINQVQTVWSWWTLSGEPEQSHSGQADLFKGEKASLPVQTLQTRFLDCGAADKGLRLMSEALPSL